MKLTLDPQLFALFPHIRIGVLRGKLLPGSSADSAKLDALRAASLSGLQSSFSDVKSLEDDSRIKSWMDTYKKMGVNPRKSKPTHWALASRLVKDGKWPRPIGPIIDVYLVNQMCISFISNVQRAGLLKQSHQKSSTSSRWLRPCYIDRRPSSLRLCRRRAVPATRFIRSFRGENQKGRSCISRRCTGAHEGLEPSRLRAHEDRGHLD